MKVILDNAQEADAVVYAPGVGKTKNKAFQRRQKQVLTALAPVEGKLCCLCDSNGASRFQHPLSPSVRTWHLSPMKIEELIKNHSNQDVKEEHQGESEDNAKKSKGKKSIK